MGRFEEARDIPLRHTSEDDRWVVEAMLRPLSSYLYQHFCIAVKYYLEHFTV